MSIQLHYDAIQEGITRARLIRQDLKRHPTEYYPEKVRGLNKAYISTIKEIIRQGDLYIDLCEDISSGLEISVTIENYRSFLYTLNRDDPS